MAKVDKRGLLIISAESEKDLPEYFVKQFEKIELVGKVKIKKKTNVKYTERPGESRQSPQRRRRNMKNYKIIRGMLPTSRCTNKSIYGSPLYCSCGCQKPGETDPVLDLSDVTIARKADDGYANYILSRDGKEIGSYNVQYSAIYMNGHEFLGVDDSEVSHLLKMVRNKTYPGATAEKKELDEQDRRNDGNCIQRHSGYCRKCHSYCYGDCEA